MIRRLLKALTVRYFFQFLLVWGLVVGPHGSLEAMMLLDGDCATACPCDAQEEAAPAKAEPCSDDCEDCSCKASFFVALAPSTIGTTPARIAAERESTSELLPTPGEFQDIFIPPRR
jgi:hypothetical protein